MKKVFRPYFAFMINSLERWLSFMAENGWRLVCVKKWWFYFVPSASIKRQYFLYVHLDASKGGYYDYFSAQRKYANKQRIKSDSVHVFEVDERKWDEQGARYKDARNRHYMHKFLAITILFMLFFVISVGISIYYKTFYILLMSALNIPLVAYGLIGWFVLRKERCRK